MPNYFKEDGDAMVVGGGYGGYGGGGGFGGGGFGSCFALIILVVIVLWLLFSRDKDGNGYGSGNGNCNGGGYPVYPPYAPYPFPYGGGGNCNNILDCKIPMAPDMSNCEVDKDIWKLDAHMERCCCEEKEVTHMEAEATRALINANTMQELREKLAEKASEIQALKTQQYTDAKFDALNAKLCKDDNENDKQYYGLSRQIESIKCALDCFPKLPPVYFEGITPNTHHTDCRHDDFPRRRKFNDCDCECGCN